MYSLASGLYSYYFTPKSISVLIVGCEESGKTALLERCKISKFTKPRFAPSSTVESSRRKSHNNELRKENGACAESSVDIHRNSKYGDQRSTTTTASLSKGQQPLNMSKIRPTVGQNIAKNLDLFGSKALIWDLAGRKDLRGIWSSYFGASDAIIFVVDGTIFFSESNTRIDETKEELLKILLDNNLTSVPLLVWVNKLDAVLDHLKKCDKGKTPLETVDVAYLDYVQEELYECVMQLLGLTPTAKGPSLTTLSPCPELIDVPPTHSSGKGGRPGRIEVFVGSAKTGQGVRPAMEWLAKAASHRQS